MGADLLEILGLAAVSIPVVASYGIYATGFFLGAKYADASEETWNYIISRADEIAYRLREEQGSEFYKARARVAATTIGLGLKSGLLIGRKSASD